MNKAFLASRLLPDMAHINPACFNFSESEARAKGLWTDDRPMPTEEELAAEAINFETTESYKGKRSDDYIADGLHFNKFVELLIEDDTAGIAEFRAKRDAIKIKHPKG